MKERFDLPSIGELADGVVSVFKKYVNNLTIGKDIYKVNIVPLSKLINNDNPLFRDYDELGFTIPLDATQTLTSTLSSKVVETPAENYTVYQEGVIKNPTTISVSACIDNNSAKRDNIEAIHKLMIPCKIMHLKTLPGIVNTETFSLDKRVYFMTNCVFTDNDDINTVDVQMDFTEVRMFDISTREGYFASNPQTGDGNGGGGKSRSPYANSVKPVGIPDDNVKDIIDPEQRFCKRVADSLGYNRDSWNQLISDKAIEFTTDKNAVTHVEINGQHVYKGIIR